MTELYLQLIDRVLTPILLMVSIFLLLRGHNLPGGGFIAALMAAAAFELQILSRGEETVRDAVGPYLHTGIGLGLLVAATAGALGLLQLNIFKAVWFHVQIGQFLDLEVGTPVLFDLGVFLVVVSVTTSYLLGLSQVAAGNRT